MDVESWAWRSLETVLGGTIHQLNRPSLAEGGAAMGNGEVIKIEAFRTAYSLLGVGYAAVDFEEGIPRRDHMVTCEVPENTEHVLVAITCAGFTYGSVDHAKESQFSRMLHQVVKQDISGRTFKVDVRAYLQNKHEDVPWSGVIHVEIMCFGVPKTDPKVEE